MTLNKFYLLVVLLVISLVKIDYRFDEIPYGLEVDDAEYYYSAVTLGLDYDLDFSNQMEGIENRYLNIEKQKIVPFHPIGSGILAAPFVIFGNIVSKMISDQDIVSYVYFFYSLSPIFYFFISIKFIQSTLQNLSINYDNYLLLLLVMGTGVSYYAFDRFSMSHVYEFFSVSCLCYLTSKLLNLKNIKQQPVLIFLLGILIFIFLTIRWVNYFLILIPGIICLVSNNPLNKIYRSIFFLSGCFSGTILFLLHTKYLYGFYSFNQSNVVLLVENSFEDNYLRFFDFSLFFENLIFALKSLRIILFGQEFGVFYFAPILFVSIFIFLFQIREKKYLLSFLTLLTYLFPIFSIIVLQNTAFSYGFRYLFVLIPLNCILYFKYIHKSILIRRYVMLASITAILGYLFFETSQATSLSNDFLVNSFGMNTRYSNPNYLTNLPSALVSFNSYTHIVFTSFLGVFVLKLLGLITDPYIFLNNFTDLTPEIQELVSDSLNFSWIKLFIIFLAVLYLTNLITKEKRYNV